MDLHNQMFLGNSLQRWLITVGTALVITVVLRAMLGLVRSRLKKLAGTTATSWDDVLVTGFARVRFSIIAPAVFMLSGSTLTLPGNTSSVLSRVAILLLLIQAGLSFSAAFSFWLDDSRRKRLATDPGSVSGFGAIRFFGKFVIWSVILLVALDNLGIDVSTLVAGLGVSGIAVALAVQNILGDLFASLTIILDKPFIVGNFLKVGDFLGSVESIGLKTTRLRSLSGEELIFSNNDLLQSRIQNFGRMATRRVAFNLGVTYQTPPDQLEQIPALIKEAIEKNDKVRFDRSHFAKFGDFAMVYETVYYVDTPDYAVFMDIQQATYLAITRAFAERGIEFAYPTQTLFVTHQTATAAGE